MLEAWKLKRNGGHFASRISAMPPQPCSACVEKRVAVLTELVIATHKFIKK